MNLTLPIFDISKLFNKGKSLKKLDSKGQTALLEKGSGPAKVVGQLRSELSCEGDLKIPISPRLQTEFKLEAIETLKPPWRIPQLA